MEPNQHRTSEFMQSKLTTKKTEQRTAGQTMGKSTAAGTLNESMHSVLNKSKQTEVIIRDGESSGYSDVEEAFIE